MKFIKIQAAIAVTAALLLSACQPKGASAPAADSSPPVATVNGTPITRDFFEFYIKGIAGGKSSSELTKEQRDLALDNLVRAEVVAQQADKDGTLREAETQQLLEISRLNVLQQVVSERYLKDKKATEQEVRAEYESQVAAMPRQEYHVRHIQVATEAYAQKLITQIEGGAPFADVARRESMDSSKDQGGDIGWITPDHVDKTFADALQGLKPGEYTHKPVQTQFGWHIIMLAEVRPVSAPPFDSVSQRLQQVVQQKKFRAYVEQLMKGAKIEKKL